MHRNTILLVVILIAFCGPLLVKTYSNTNLQSLITSLFTTGSYNKLTRPSDDFSTPMSVFFELYLLSINSLDVVNQKMTTTAYINIYWTDDKLKWSPGSHNNIYYFYLPQSEIWRPDLSLQNGLTKLKELGDPFLVVSISNLGDVNWKPLEILETKCSIDIKYFPFDTQTYSIEFGTWMMTTHDISVDVGSWGFQLSEYSEGDEWVLVDKDAYATTSTADGAKANFILIMRRVPQYYILNILLPVFLLAVLIIMTFAIPADSGEKIGYSMTVFLSFAVFLTIVSSSLPVTSAMSLMSMYLVLLLAMGTVIVVITGFELRLHHRDTSRPVPYIAIKLVKSSRILQFRNCGGCKMKGKVTGSVDGMIEIRPLSVDEDIPNNEPENPEPEITWQDVVASIDFYCFYFFSSFVLILSIALLLIAQHS